ncbi:MAG: alcohol dehydrogenase catalytic domain-containing protein [Clostridia bacterium]|nr:alcohol dehydrogenase catalytic domain-containing protein [Clostridia bacterium]
MKGFIIKDPNTLVLSELPNDSSDLVSTSKVRITKSLITLADLLRYRGEIETKDIVLGSSGIGVISETDSNLLDIEKGKHVYVDSKKECGKCFNCVNDKKWLCSDMLIAGEDYNGFLSDFISISPEKIYPLPESVSDFDALFIDQISLALTIIDKLNIQKGDYVSIIGANNFANILAQIMIYYQAVPIVASNNYEDIQNAKDCGIYYTLDEQANWQKEIAGITSGRMAQKVVYISDCDIPIQKAFSVASVNATVIYTGKTIKSSAVSFNQAVKKQLEISCINVGFGNISSSINLLANNAVNLSKLKLNTCKFDEIPAMFEKLSKEYDEKGYINETIVEMI